MVRSSISLIVLVGIGCMGFAPSVLAQEPKRVALTEQQCQAICSMPRDEFDETIAAQYRSCVLRNFCPALKAQPRVLGPQIYFAERFWQQWRR